MKASDFKLTWRKILLGIFIAWTLTTCIDEKPTEHWLFWLILSFFVGIPALATYVVRRIVWQRFSRAPDSSSEFALFLRSFRDDFEYTLRSNRMHNSVGMPIREWMKLVFVGNEEDFEEVLIEVVGTQVVSIGSPTRRNAVLGDLGSKRVFLDDRETDWKSVVGEYIERSWINILLLGDTENFFWEFCEVIDRGALHRAILVFPPLPSEKINERWTQLREAVPSDYLYGFPTELPDNVFFAFFTLTGCIRFVRTSDIPTVIGYRQGCAEHYRKLFGQCLAVMQDRSTGVIDDPSDDLVFSSVKK